MTIKEIIEKINNHEYPIWHFEYGDDDCWVDGILTGIDINLNLTYLNSFNSNNNLVLNMQFKNKIGIEECGFFQTVEQIACENTRCNNMEDLLDFKVNNIIGIYELRTGKFKIKE